MVEFIQKRIERLEWIDCLVSLSVECVCVCMCDFVCVFVFVSIILQSKMVRNYLSSAPTIAISARL